MIHAKKSLGQNFLNSKTIARDIVRAGEAVQGDTILEIGPGKGFLTEELLASGAKVVAVEKDDRMIPLLSEKFNEQIQNGQFTLIHGDILDIIAKKPLFLAKGGASPKYKVVANIPYYLTGQIIREFLEIEEKPERMVLMVQKEVAMRIVASDKKESILSIAVKVYGKPKLIKKVPARYFSPEPNVDSAILSITDISGKNFSDKNAEKTFFEVLRAGFSHKRKMLAGNLKPVFGVETIKILKESGISEKARAEDLSLEKWTVLSGKQ